MAIPTIYERLKAHLASSETATPNDATVEALYREWHELDDDVEIETLTIEQWAYRLLQSSTRHWKRDAKANT